MTPEITWTSAGPDQFEAWHDGRQWMLLRQTRQSGRPAGWYLHATVGKGVYDKHGRRMDSRISYAQDEATALILSPQGREMAEIADREAGAEEERMTPETELPDRESLVDEAEAVEFDRRSSGIDDEHPNDFRDVE